MEDLNRFNIVPTQVKFTKAEELYVLDVVKDLFVEEIIEIDYILLRVRVLTPHCLTPINDCAKFSSSHSDWSKCNLIYL